MSRRSLAIVISTVLIVTLPATPAAAHSPSTLSLPQGFQPEGIAIADAPYAYLGSRLDGDIFRLNLRSGEGRVLSQGPGTPPLGLKLDGRDRLFVAGGSGGDARVIDVRSGKLLKAYRLQTGTAFINDVVLTGGAAWFTDSANQVLFKLPFGKRGELPAAAVRVPLTGDFRMAEGNNANGISATPDGRALIVVQSNTGKLFRTTYAGVTREIDLGGQTVENGDGLWLRRNSLYVVQNRLNQIAQVELSRDATSGRVVSRTTDPRFDVPTTIAESGDRFYLPNARFTTPATPTTTYDVVRIRIP
ncbi:superoxide dismutase [Actinoplanes sp. TBRC 11911]|uniref:SMP-30/gluconolactonase/LRE family protein n=1 Tax=Actinoplanes sp. TBRC 11911 TaxID=2729386 RepID=UPI00145F7CDB|nr:superoxide dismutase [Actinoplanes sp. TBRC 11911]NMO52948.1 superoxide dismutase [Actinoplanes sp. TBRC 11911]